MPVRARELGTHPLSLAGSPFLGVGRYQLVEEPEDRLVERHVDNLPLTASVPALERNQNTQGSIEARRIVRERRRARRHRRTVRHPGQIGQSAESLRDARESGALLVGACLSVTGAPQQHPLRIDLIQEELNELKDAMNNKDLLEVADALTDILYVTYGAGHAFGINLDKCFEEVQKSNMSKLGNDGRPIYNEQGKVMKGPNYFKPDLKKFVA